ncbi:MAG: hypothetical protein ACT4RN_09820 [Pseudonocardia sp.]
MDEMTDMDEVVSVPGQRRVERDISIRELRNAGKVMAELAAAGAVGQVTSGGRLVGWLLPVDEADRRAEQLTADGRLRPAARSGGLAGRRPLPPRAGVPSMGETLERMRSEEGG